MVSTSVTATKLEVRTVSSGVSGPVNGRTCLYSCHQFGTGKGVARRLKYCALSVRPRLNVFISVVTKAGVKEDSDSDLGHNGEENEGHRGRSRRRDSSAIESQFERKYPSSREDTGRSQRRGYGEGYQYGEQGYSQSGRRYDMDIDDADARRSLPYRSRTRQGDFASPSTRRDYADDFDRQDFDDVPRRGRSEARPEWDRSRTEGDPPQRDRQALYRGEDDVDGNQRTRPLAQGDGVGEPRNVRRSGYNSAPPGARPRSTMGALSSDRRQQPTRTMADSTPAQVSVDIFSRLGKDATFRELGLSAVMARALQAYGCASPTEIQARAIPWVLAGHSCAVLAETGSGKTFSYALPLCQRLHARPPTFPPEQKGRIRPRRGPGAGQDDPPPCQPRAVVLVPSGHLAYQTASFVRLAAEMCGTQEGEDPSLAVDVLSKQKKAGPAPGPIDMLVATPGRVVAEVEAQRLSLASLETLVLDEADELLSDGFLPVLSRIVKMGARLKGTKATKLSEGTLQVVFVGATLGRELWDERVKELFPGKLRRIASDRLHRVPDRLECKTLAVPPGDTSAKNGMLLSILTSEHRGKKTLVFTRDPDECAQVLGYLREQGMHTCSQYSGRASSSNVLEEFMHGVLDVLVCTDIGARGLDFPDVEHVVQYTLAPTIELYLHRIGRTARVGQQRACFATSLVDIFHDNKDLLTAIHFDPQTFKGKALIETKASADAWL